MKKLKINGIVYNQKEDGTLVPETPATPEAPKADEPKVEEPKVESADEPKDEDETKMAGVIAEKLADAIVAREKSPESVDKMKGVQPSAPQFSGQAGKIKLYTLKSGKVLTMAKDEAELVGNWLKSVLKRDNEGRKKAWNGLYEAKLEPMVEGTDADGGFLVPNILYNRLFEVVQDRSVMQQLAFEVDMSGMKTDSLDVSQIAGRPIATWSGENTDKGTSSMTIANQTITPYTLAVIATMSQQIVDDSPFAIVPIFTRKLGEAIALEEDRAFFAGSGSGRPTGLNQVTLRGVNFGGALPTYDLVNALYWRLPQAYRANATWVANGRLLEALSNVKDTNGMPIFKELITNPGMMGLKGRPVFEQNDLASTELYFGDFQNYIIGRKHGVRVSISDQATITNNQGSQPVSLWQRNLIGIRAETRVDGELVVNPAFVKATAIAVS